MAPFRTAALAAFLLLMQHCTTGSAFIPRTNNPVQTAEYAVVRKMASSNSNRNDPEDPTKGFIASIADTVQNVLTNSPLNEGKKALVRSLAGDYDEAAIRSKLDGLISDKPVLMFSFRR
jgi:hypothetical protein